MRMYNHCFYSFVHSRFFSWLLSVNHCKSEQSGYNMFWYNFLHVSCAWGLLRFVDLGFIVFIPFEEMLTIISPNMFSVSHPLPLGTPMICILSILDLTLSHSDWCFSFFFPQSSLFFFNFYFFLTVFHFGNFYGYVFPGVSFQDCTLLLPTSIFFIKDIVAFLSRNLKWIFYISHYFI